MNKNRKIIFLNKNPDELKFEKNPNSLVVTYDLLREEILRNEKYIVLNFHRFVQSKENWKEVVSSSLEWFNSFTETKINSNKTIVETLNFENTSLWWFIYDTVWESKNGVFDIFYNIKGIEFLLKKYNPNEIEVIGTFDFPIKEILEIFKKKYKFSANYNKYFMKKISKDSDSLLYKIKLFVEMLFLKFIKNPKNKSEIGVFLKHGSSALEKNRKGQKLIIDHYVNEFTEYFFENREKFSFISRNLPGTKKGISNILQNFLMIFSGIFYPWIGYSSFSDLKMFKNNTEFYSKKFEELKDQHSFRKVFQIEDVDSFQLFNRIFLEQIPRLLAFVRLELEISKKYFIENNPRIIFTTDSISPAGRALCFRASQIHKKVITPQGGIISSEIPVNMGFLIHKNFDKKILPTYLVWGEYHKKILENRNYPSNLIKKVGFWQIQNEKIENSEFGKYILYIAGANLNKLEYILSLEEEIFTIKKIHIVLPKGYRLVVKLHPSLSNQFYKEKIGELNSIILLEGSSNIDVESLINNAEIIVGKGSTLLIQAAIKNKPVIIINLKSNLNFIGIDSIPFVTSIDEYEQKQNEFINEGLTPDYHIERFIHKEGKEAVNLIIKELESCE
ncbi:MAG: hypothetical protein K5790_09775 [Nitrosopumilus sp.]|uniref:hypothetical protein n=1 Tax=Nitrosopumilus sp. TaxID=2024843 RepID=UPI00247E21BC|nr:hypothetical protein [Nitrosopumilus sp.]MCV0393559.1 hypothetical protein [Nitrosopumilus sp.]